ncbi:PAS domain S-box-containing protein [Cnuella takakiae]|uniref:histidine kinase n=1 Tax=Cnuella takakiae TaxID=1302690 RepID=A0A1M5GWC2_9BACT|nr:PAS domain-containing sensor histidine kinase [Cnuella takakiae]OLY90864.1 hypothetical protein BUE76_02355 [Cnuella takakiae]SHG08019.1 PAS domain S-box-containing protein [Cnuella takakiae]
MSKPLLQFNAGLAQHSLAGAQDLATLRRVADSFPFPVTLLSLEGKLIFANKTWLQGTGAPSKDALLKNWRLYIHPADQRAAAVLFDQPSSAGLPPFEFRVRQQDGQYQWFLGQPSVLLDAMGEALYVLAICTNINEKKELENNLVQQEERLNLAVTAAELGIFDYDVVTDTTVVNDKARELYELAPGEPFGFTDFISKVHPEDREAVSLNNVNFISNPNSPLTYRNNFRVVLSGGQVRWYANLGRVYVNEQGQRYRVLGTILDQTAEKQAFEELRYKEEKLRLASEATGMAWWHNDLKAGVLTSSPLLNTIYGLDADTRFTFQHFADGIHPDDREWVLEMNHRLMEGRAENTEYETTFRVLCPNGQVKWMRALGRIFLDAEGKPARFVGTAQDVTSAVEGAALIEASEQKLRTITNASPVGLWMTNGNGMPVFANQTWLDWTGMRFETLQQEGCLYATAPEEQEGILQSFTIAFESRQPFAAEHRLLGAHGSQRWIYTEAKPYFDTSGAFAGYVASSADITNRKLAELSLQESEARFRQLADSSPQAVWTANPDGQLDYCNRIYFEFTGNSLECLDEATWLASIHPQDRQHCLDLWFEAVRSGKVFEIEYRWLHAPSRQYRWVLGRALPLRDEQGNIIKWLGTGTDIHDTRNMAEALEEAVQRRTKEYIRLNASLQRSNEDLQHFAHVVSHDLKEPLRKIKVFSDQLRNKATGMEEPQQLLLQKIMDAAKRMSSMVDGILNYSILGGESEELEEVDLVEVVRLVESDLELLISQRSARIFTGDLPKVEGHPILLQQLFDNLLSNALKFCKGEAVPEIRISASLLPHESYSLFPQLQPRLEYCTITVADNGIGFSEASAEKIFDVFHRLHPRSRYEGTGLGLSLCRKIVERHKGHIYAQSTEGSGASFHIILPLTQPLKQ